MTARRLAYVADPQAAVARARIEEKQRRVTVRPAPDTMCILTAYLPAAQGIAAWAALGQHADSCVAAGDPRTRSQIMADGLVERLTGQGAAGDVKVEIGLVMPLDCLTDPDTARPAQLADYGPIPAPLARDLLATTQGALFLRRLFTAKSGQIVDGDGRGVCARGNYVREMPGWQVKLLDAGLSNRPHAVSVTAPTGHTYAREAPQPP